MGCCGGRRKGNPGNPGARVPITGTGDVVTLAYAGDKRGTQSMMGPVTRKWYSFSASPVNNRIQVARADAEYFLRRRDFVLMQEPAPTPMPEAPLPQIRLKPSPMPQVQAVAQPTTKASVSLEEEEPADDLSGIKGITKDTAGILALVGIRTFDDLAQLEKIEATAQLTGKSEMQVRKWIKAAKEKIRAEELVEEDDFGGLRGRGPGHLGVDLPDDLLVADEEIP